MSFAFVLKRKRMEAFFPSYAFFSLKLLLKRLRRNVARRNDAALLRQWSTPKPKKEKPAERVDALETLTENEERLNILTCLSFRHLFLLLYLFHHFFSFLSPFFILNHSFFLFLSFILFKRFLFSYFFQCHLSFVLMFYLFSSIFFLSFLFRIYFSMFFVFLSFFDVFFLFILFNVLFFPSIFLHSFMYFQYFIFPSIFFLSFFLFFNMFFLCVFGYLMASNISVVLSSFFFFLSSNSSSFFSFILRNFYTISFLYSYLFRYFFLIHSPRLMFHLCLLFTFFTNFILKCLADIVPLY
ncbi:unnamed protein product [Acanthosepion pharaonis]|uniref:Uncharacterized protein n=1 Tax=Acanthosepion pharaonis TaxID=158019 RepID=A0A812CXJ1_ACAPH|nr:unnamed protein product [Sepia pharaonis]